MRLALIVDNIGEGDVEKATARTIVEDREDPLARRPIVDRAKID